MASSKETYCLCGQPYNIGQFMIECDCCREWFHGSCVNVKIYQSDDIDKYHCPKCAQTYGPSLLKVPTNNHRADRYEIGSESRVPQAGAPAWVRALAARPLRPTSQASTRALPQQFTEDLFKNNGFTKPVIFSTPEGLDLKMPNAATFTVRSVLRFCGAQFEVEVIDVRKQTTLRMPLGDFIEYFETPPEQREDKVLNILSLEFSNTAMSSLVEPPAIARKLDWALRVWPITKEGPPKPSVQKYCLMSAGGSYTDFHVDFGGTMVWYHVLHGRKIFFLIPPTSTNLALYQQWCASTNHSERFFGDMVEWYGTTELLPGETLFIPAGWIHAVLSPDDCLVFGGNLLHEYAIEMQLQIYEIERRVETPMSLRYPLFETMHWYAGSYLLTMLRRHNEDTQDEDFTLHECEQRLPPSDLPPLLVRGIRILANALKEWHTLKTTDQQKRDNIPKCINSGQIVKDLCRELRTLEKVSSSINNKDRELKAKIHTTTSKSHSKKHSSSHKRSSIKLTLPKPIMHMPTTASKEFQQDKVVKEEVYQSVDKDLYQEARYSSQNRLEECKAYNDGKEEKEYFQNYEEHYQTDGNGYVERLEKKNGGSALQIKLGNNSSPSSSREDPPPYSLSEHSILKSHLIGQMDRQAAKPTHKWTTSVITNKNAPGDYHEEQIMFTNENLPANVIDNQDINYGPGMYSTEDIQPDYHYSESAKPGSYQPDYSYQNQSLPPDISIQYQVDPNSYVNGRMHTELEARYDKNYEMEQPIVTQQIQTTYVTVPLQQDLNGYHQEQLPSYDAAMAQQYGAGYIIQEQKPLETQVVNAPNTPTTPVRRSERPIRRRVSPTYDYEDGDLYIDETPAPARRKSNKHKHHYNRHAVSNNSYRQRAAPANGIESLIQASVLAEEPEHNTEDAAAAMLSISERYTVSQPAEQSPNRTFGLANNNPLQSPSKRARKPLPSPPDEEEDEDVIKEVHRDEEYVYPSLEMSSEDEDEWTRSRRRRHLRSKPDVKGRSEKDESWSPRARLGRLVPRSRGPVRANVRRECVRAALHAAASSTAQHAPPNAKRAVLAAKSRRPPPPAPTSPTNKNSRLKKGMKTAKQRLGKILKIHKLMY